MINYYCPGFVEAQPIYARLFYLYKNHSQCFYNNVKIKKIYGNFPNMIWNGGTVWMGPSFSRQQIIDYFRWYSDKDVQLQLICTNPVLQPQDLNDRYCNLVLDIASQFNFVEVLVSSPILESYIRQKHPHMKIDKSIIGTSSMVNTSLDTVENYLQLLDNYNMMVLPKKYAKDFDFLNQIPQEKRNKIEILVTDPCPTNCPYIYKHYQDYGRAQLGEISPQMAGYCFSIDDRNQPFRHWVNRKCQYDYNEICASLEPLGFSEIKISGRANAGHVLLSIIPFLIKPEYQLDVYTSLMDPYYPDILSPEFV